MKNINKNEMTQSKSIFKSRIKSNYKTAKLLDKIIFNDFNYKSVRIKNIKWSNFKNLVFVTFDHPELENTPILINISILKMITKRKKVTFEYLKSLFFDLIITKGYIVSNINNEFILRFKNKNRLYCSFISISGKETIGDIIFNETKKLGNFIIIEKFLIENN